LSKPIQIVIIIACLAGAGFLLYYNLSKPSPTANEGVPEFIHFTCADRKCGHQFTWEQGSDTGGREIDTCPKCGTPEAGRSAKCQQCGHFQVLTGHGAYEKICPECGAELPPLREQK
jgi:hypothetical protein